MRMRESGISTRALIEIIIAVVVVATVIATLYLFTREKWTELPGGPRTNIRSLMSGGISVTPEVGTTAIYGYYFSGNRIGSYSVKYAGEIPFQGVACYKSEVTSSVALSVAGATVEFTMQGYKYDNLDGFPKYMSVIYNYSQPYQATMLTEYTWNRVESKIHSKVTATGATIENDITVPTEYWEPIGNLYVGYSKQFKCTFDGTSFTMIINVTGETDITVPKGTYHCYMVGISEPELGVEMTVWIDTTGGYLSQMEISISGIPITMKLERYGIAG